MEIRSGQFIGIMDKTIVTQAETPDEAARSLLGHMIQSGEEIVTILTGEEAGEEDGRRLAEWVSGRYPDAEVEVHDGGQPLYPYLIAVEP